jgi:hypothetical protein
MNIRADDCKKLNALLEAASDAVMAASDDEILAEAKQDHANPEARVAALRKMATERIAVAKRQRLAQARRAFDAARNPLSDATLARTVAQMQARIGELLSQYVAPENRLTLAFRNGEALSEADTASLLEDLEALAKLQHRNP